MKRILAFFKDRRVISVIGLIALSIIIWFAGPQVHFGESNYAPLGTEFSRLLTIIVILLLWGLNNLRVQIQKNKQNDNLIESIEDSQQQPDDGFSGQNTEEMAVLRERFSQAMLSLKKLKFKGKYGKKGVYELPWYIIIGPPGSGKTTALINSGLDFPLADKVGKGALKGIGGTRNCDWWFTNDAVLIDTAGRYTTQDSHRVVDSSAWKGFLSLLKKNRPRRPINGAIIAISVADLLIQTEEQRNQHARTIRHRIDELMEELGVRFPIYVMLTKSDLISGFSEFFEDLSRAEREQVWGVTFKDLSSASLSADIDWFSSEYNLLLDRINDRLLHRMHQERDLNRRGAIEVFPQQMEILKPTLTSFLKQVFAPSRYHFQPYMRGAYFSSGTQDGTPIDRMMSTITANMGLQRDAAHLPSDQGKSYFINRLFNDIIFPESELVGLNQKFERALSWMRRGGYIAFATAFIGCIAVWTTSVMSNKSLLNEVEASIENFNKEAVKAVSVRSGIKTTIPALNSLREASSVYEQEQHPWLVSVGMYDPAVDDAAKQAYHTQLQSMLLPRVQRYLAQEINKLIKQPEKKGELYEAFRYYYMFQKIDHLEPEQISDWFKERWDQSLHGQASRKGQLITHLDTLLALDLKATQLNKRLVTKSRKSLLKVPPSRRIYSRVRTNPVYSKKIDLNNLFGDVLDNGFTTSSDQSLLLPVLFTKDGYDDVELDAESPVIEAILKDNWVLGDKANTDFQKADLDEISKQVNDYYLKEYSSRWQKALENIKIEKFKNMQQAVDMLAVFADPIYSPIVSILKTASNNTTLNMQAMLEVPGGDSGSSLLQKTSSLVSGKLEGNRVDKRFKDLNKLTRESSKRPAPIEKMLKSIENVHDYLNEMSVSSNPNQAAFDASKARFQNGGSDAIKKLRAIATKAPKPVNTWLHTIADESWKVTLASAKGHINNEWRSLVTSKFNHALAGRYPVSAKAAEELTLDDFTDFFKTSGTVDSFVSEYVGPFVDVKRRWRVKTVNNRSMYFSKESLKQLKRATTIRKIFFRTNPESPSIGFQIRPVRLDKSITKFELEMGGQRLNYSHGPKFWNDMTWPGEEGDDLVRVEFVDIEDEPYIKEYEGPWGWFKLINDSRLKKTKSANIYNVVFAIDGQEAHYQIKAKSVTNPFSTDILSKFNFPESL